MELIQVDITSAEPLATFPERELKILRPKIQTWRLMVEVSPNLGGDNYVVPIALQTLAQQLLAVTMPIDVGSIKEVTAKVKSGLYRGKRSLIVSRTIAVSELVSSDGPCAEPNLARLQLSLTEYAIIQRRDQSLIRLLLASLTSRELIVVIRHRRLDVQKEPSA